MLKPKLKAEHKHLCNHNRAFTTHLFGDDISKSAREIEDSAKISQKVMQSKSTVGYRFSGDPYNTSRPSRFRGRRMRRGYSTPRPGFDRAVDSKTYPRRGSQGLLHKLKVSDTFQAGRLHFFVEKWKKVNKRSIYFRHGTELS